MMIKRLLPFFLPALLVLFAACYRTSFSSPHGYDLVHPEKKELSATSLAEISGIAFHRGAYDTIYAINDEQGKLFYFTKNNLHPAACKFDHSGDYEDVSITREKVVVLKSNGELFVFPFSTARSEEADSVVKIKLLPKSEYEGLYADSSGRLYVLCKHCTADNPAQQVTIYTLVPDSTAVYRNDATITLDVPAIKQLSNSKKLRFTPSALAQHPITHEWYIFSSFNKMLVIADSSFHITAAYPLKPNLFRQPEGLAFDSQGNMYVSNEAKEDEPADLMIFPYKP